MYRLYYAPGACSLAAHIILEEIGEPYALDLRTTTEGGGVASAEYAAINPKQIVPALSGGEGLGDRALTELSAILLYLGGRHPEAGLLPTDLAGQARCIEWTNWLTSIHGRCLSPLNRPHRFTDDPEAFDGVRAKARLNLAHQHGLIERALSDGRTWAVGPAYGVVDANLMLHWIWGRRVGADMTAYPHWRALVERIAARPAVRRVIAAEDMQDYVL